MKFAKWLSVMTLAVLVGLVWKSDRGQGQNPSVKSTIIVSEIGHHSPTAVGTELTLFTPAVTGLYRITAYAEVALANNAGGLCANVLWNDGSANPRDYPINFGASGCASSGKSGGGDIIVHAAAGQRVSLTVSPEGGFQGGYDLFVTVEQLMPPSH